MNDVHEALDPQIEKRWWLRAITVRLRFIVAIILVAAVMAAWPWLQTAWERWSSKWSGQHGQYAVSGDTEFFCPMDPGIVTAWPSICPICSMDLISRKKSDAVLLPEGVLARMQVSPYRVQLAGVKTAVIQANESEPNTFTVPTTALVHRDVGSIVYIETMPGMFDAVPVQVKDQGNENTTVAGKLTHGQYIVTNGTFLLDAETRLNPNIATQYFGAHQAHTFSAPPTLARRPDAPQPLSPADQQIIDQQRICPVTRAPLGSMGQPLFVNVGDRKVAICCKGCEKRLLADSEHFLAILDENAKSASPSPPVP